MAVTPSDHGLLHAAVHRERMKALWAEPEFRSGMLLMLRSRRMTWSQRQQRAEQARGLWQRPAYRAFHTERLRKLAQQRSSG